MFEYSILHWTTFLTAALLLNVSPGPDFAFILGHTIKGGKRAGFAAMGGIWTGAFGHAVMSALGLSAILATSATAFTLVKWVGAVYLVWLGVMALRSKGAAFEASDVVPQPAGWAIMRQGILVSLLNPKVAIFFLAFLPQFVVPGAGPVWAQLLLHGVLVILVAALVEPPLILIGGRLSKALKGNKKIGLWMDRTLGVILVSLGIRLALQER